MDIFIITFLILITGGIESWFSFLLLLNVIGAGIILGKNSVFIIAAISSVVFGVVIEFQYYEMIPVRYNQSLRFEDFFYHIFANVAALLLIAYLSRYLIVRVEKTSKKLEKTESDLRNLHSFHKDVIENIASGLFSTDTNGVIKLYNRSAEWITGMKREHAIGKNYREIFRFMRNPLKKGRFKGSIPVSSKRKIIGLSISEHRDNSNQMKGYVGTFQDLTRITKMEKDIKEKEKLAAIGELSANIAHEIRNPLASLKSSIEMLKENNVHEKKSRRLMDIALHEMDRLNNIITDFLIYSNPTAANFKEVSLNGILRETIEMLKRSISDNGDVALGCECKDDIVIQADEDKLKQVFWNLGLNAIQSLNDGGEIVVSVNRMHDSVKILFHDSGAGIEQGNLKKIFYPFFTTKTNGTGLGLAMVYRIVNEHSGKIKVQSTVGKGSAFEIILPKEQRNEQG